MEHSTPNPIHIDVPVDTILAENQGPETTMVCIIQHDALTLRVVVWDYAEGRVVKERLFDDDHAAEEWAMARWS